MTAVYETYSPEETMALGRELSETASPGDIICLNGDLGSGKTVFTKGFAKGLGVEDTVVSPTFTIIQEYYGGRMPLYHFDVYRIEDADEMAETGMDEYFYGDGVCLIEWSSLIAELIPSKAWKVLLEKEPEKGDDYRKITVYRPETTGHRLR
ncbi:MAG: tRNA (adenosine(37)-N6)-threonylcarbamoyltransferase complex ATPase subunit type 1 TsaE [Lachnospiraceae bacterium]|nr:tRNA (adenosine(37)-N6)-threonylcarbamoyltransferase complex ATPase subunit type 1 TsaE [Lachnospiraceae bacterium]